MKGFSTETERALIDKSIEIARYEESLNDLVLMSVSFAYDDQRKKLDEQRGVLWVYLKHDQEKRMSNKKEYTDYQEPTTGLTIDTSKVNVEDCLEKVVEEYRTFCSMNHYKQK
jgi:hypothetical protein